MHYDKLVSYYSLPNSKILDQSKLKTSDDKKEYTQKINFVLGKVENLVGKGENDYQHFLLFLQCFQKLSFLMVIKSQDYAVKS